MKKLFLFTILLISCGSTYGQVRFGFRVAPVVAYNRAQIGGDTYAISNNGASIKFQLGPTFDFPFRENHYFGTGIYFSTKQADLKFVDNRNGVETIESYDLQYIQIPLSLKLYTEEVGLDKKLYFQFGGNLDVRTQGILANNNLLEQVSLFDLSALLAIGLEYRLGINTKIFGGVVYNRGILNAVKKTSINEDWRLNNDVLGLEFGVTF